VRRTGILAGLGAACIWGANYSIAKRVLTEVDPLAVAFVRAAAAVPAFAVLLLARDGRGAFPPARLRRVLPLALLGIVANQLLFIVGLERTSAAHSAILIALMPIAVLLIAAAARQERPGPRRVAGILLAFTGVVAVVLEQGIDLRAASVRGDLITLLSVLAFAGYTVAGRRVVRDLGVLRTTALAYVLGGAAILAVAAPAAARQDWSGLSAAAAGGLLYTAILSTIAAYLLHFLALERIEASQVAAFAYAQVVVAAVVSFLIAGEPLTRTFAAGAALIVLGLHTAERG
jgi:drug/metabolite transporter (DMT)-like permease